MPISKEEWNKGRKATTTEAMVEDFLRRNKGQAFKDMEIVHGLYSLKYESVIDWLGNFANVYDVKEALKTLVSKGIAKAKVVKEAIGTDTYCGVD